MEENLWKSIEKKEVEKSPLNELLFRLFISSIFERTKNRKTKRTIPFYLFASNVVRFSTFSQFVRRHQKAKKGNVLSKRLEQAESIFLNIEFLPLPSLWRSWLFFAAFFSPQICSFLRSIRRLPPSLPSPSNFTDRFSHICFDVLPLTRRTSFNPKQNAFA